MSADDIAILIGLLINNFLLGYFVGVIIGKNKANEKNQKT